ncbi:hypothetical protein GCM10027076_00470 [Nocardioides montaniterrae]
MASTPARRMPRRLPLLAAAGVAAAAAVGFAVVPGLSGSDRAIALAPTAPLSFPVTATWLPPSVSPTRFFSYGDLGLQIESFRAGEDGIAIGVGTSYDTVPPLDHSVPVDINGIEGRAFDATGDDRSRPEYGIAWQLPDGRIVQVSGGGRFDDPALLERVADSVVERAQPVDLTLSLAPSGWRVTDYQSDDHVTYADPADDHDQDLSVSIRSSVGADLDDYYRLEDLHDITVDGRHGVMARLSDGWLIETSAADGQAFALMAPTSLTEDQAIQVAAGVRHR